MTAVRRQACGILASNDRPCVVGIRLFCHAVVLLRRVTGRGIPRGVRRLMNCPRSGVADGDRDGGQRVGGRKAVRGSMGADGRGGLAPVREFASGLGFGATAGLILLATAGMALLAFLG